MTPCLTRPVPRLVAALLVLLLTSCGADDPSGAPADGSGDGTASGSRIDIDGQEALTWGEGGYGVVLAHGAAFDAASWSDQAPAIADLGTTVVAVEDISPDGIGAAVGHLRDEGIAEVALVGGSAGADAILRLLAEQPDLAHQVVLLSPNTTVDGLGDQPKLFVASEDEGVADVVTELAATAPGEANEAVLLPGSAHAQHLFDTDRGDELLDLVLERLAAYGDL